MAHHVCSEKCSPHIPKINYAAINANDIFDDNVILNVAFCNSLCDVKCPESDCLFAMEIFKEFIQENDEFEANLTNIELHPTHEVKDKIFVSESNVDRVASLIVEYRKCGKMCLYKKVDYDFEILILLINEFEYLYFGHAHGHAFYGMPGLTYLSSDGSSPEVSKLFPKKVNDSFVPIPLNELLESANYFLESLLLDRYH
ncbi:predicted protein [Naegleria gruberi]|uniref:Predicted protein n=1 Tax=Naegleria gruberi TaxID=5762 RepID=D2VDA0_NAEGR|nr:uncharacterized protein NAEGRDRAFT_66769 [Naegleria gruberi]EFC45197.1 predicted protein [Naegleria gruberi]|eukprot:XP_002677941.1 predicted protein [Naegleria gruberi strain NEG-M]